MSEFVNADFGLASRKRERPEKGHDTALSTALARVASAAQAEELNAEHAKAQSAAESFCLAFFAKSLQTLR
jgi:hypothetical protein